MLARQGHNLQQLDWDQKKQGVIFSSFYMGYTAMQLPIGLVIERTGGKPVMLIALYLSALLSILTPLAIGLGDAPALFAIRFLLGCVQAGIFSAVSRLLATWIPIGERGRIGGLLNCGAPVVNIYLWVVVHWRIMEKMYDLYRYLVR